MPSADSDSRRRLLYMMFTYVAIAALLTAILRNTVAPGGDPRVSYSDFAAEVKAGKVAEVRISEREFAGILKQPEGEKTPPKRILATRLPGLEETDLLRDLERHGVKITGTIETESRWWQFLLGWGPLLLLLIVYMPAMSRMRAGVGGFTFGKSTARVLDQPSRTGVSFKDVAGVDEAEAELVEIVDFLKTPARYQRLGGRIPKGVLLVGPPGTGKTLLARAVSGEAGVPFFSLSGSEFVEMFVGVGAARVRDLFEQAKLRAPCIIFIDELDAIGKSRAGRGVYFSHEEREQTLNQLLAEIDGFDPSKGVIIMAATNTPEVLDPALLRSGRFDRQVVVDRPDLKGREEILKVHARKVTLGPDVNLGTLAARTPGMVGADLANIVNEAALMAARREADATAMADFEDATDRVMLGLERKSCVMSRDEKRRVACHEAGHALVALSLPHADPVHRISIIPRSIGALGHTLQLPTEERYLMTRSELEDRIAVMLGGRAAEEICHPDVSTGAADDLECASELARQMVTRFGMSVEMGKVAYGRSAQSKYLPLPGMEGRNYSDETARRIDTEVRRLVDAMYARARQALERRREELERIIAGLIEKETLHRDELQALLRSSTGGQTPASPPPPADSAPPREQSANCGPPAPEAAFVRCSIPR
ncbi:MAG: ATP-dependent zinc metalloprotease FtsH [Bryobacteraceae bacterium]|nr:ATP-dependent zinc metalloprotease FtsH [Bryobacteraceae bacterium]